MELLFGHDYMNRSILELMSHPDFDNEVFQFTVQFMSMNTDQIRQLMSKLKETENNGR